MDRCLFFFFMVIYFITGNAQTLSVQRFWLDNTDLTAITEGTVVLDQKKQRCALIKVENTNKGFSFDTGKLKIVKRVQKNGETWLYVPEGVKSISVSHNDYGSLKSYDLGMVLKRGKTYVMQLEMHSKAKSDYKAWYCIRSTTGKTLKEPEFDLNEYISIEDIRSDTIIKICDHNQIYFHRKRGYSVGLLPHRDQGLYCIKIENDACVICITNPFLFWKESKYLCISYEEKNINK